MARGYDDENLDPTPKAPKPKRPRKSGNPLDKLDDFFNKMFKFSFKTVGMIALVIVLLILGKTCIFQVSSAEQAVIKRFGAVVGTRGAGLQFKLPYPIETASIANVKEVLRMEIGYRETNGRSTSVSEESLMLTSDENIVSIDLIVQYQIKDIEAYLFNLDDVEATLQLATEASIREVAGKSLIDDLLTTGKEVAQEETRTLLQEILDKYNAGVRIVAVELQDIEPPAQVTAAFQDVASAREDKNKYINEAQAYENQKIPMARAQAATIVLEAESYRAAVLSRAEGEAEQFRQIYESYRQTKDITRRRMYLEAMANVINNSEILVVDESIENLNLFTDMEQLSLPKASGGNQ
jgi:membrane protease subunit HflK